VANSKDVQGCDSCASNSKGLISRHPRYANALVRTGHHFPRAAAVVSQAGFLTARLEKRESALRLKYTKTPTIIGATYRLGSSTKPFLRRVAIFSTPLIEQAFDKVSGTD
jgi:hypothetical protein